MSQDDDDFDQLLSRIFPACYDVMRRAKKKRTTTNNSL
jgi:hypothetical protein